MNSGDVLGAIFLVLTAILITWWALTVREK